MGWDVFLERQELKRTNDSLISWRKKRSGHQYAPRLTVSLHSPYCNFQTFIFLWWKGGKPEGDGETGGGGELIFRGGLYVWARARRNEARNSLSRLFKYYDSSSRSPGFYGCGEKVPRMEAPRGNVSTESVRRRGRDKQAPWGGQTHQRVPQHAFGLTLIRCPPCASSKVDHLIPTVNYQ